MRGLNVWQESAAGFRVNRSAPTILLVEDEAVIRELLKRCLDRSNFTVLLAGDGVEGLTMARECRPDLIILDNVMPNMTGVEMFQALRASAETRFIPVVFATAFAKCCEAVIAQDKNARIVQKPFLLSELIGCVRSLTCAA